MPFVGALILVIVRSIRERLRRKLVARRRIRLLGAERDANLLAGSMTSRRTP